MVQERHELGPCVLPQPHDGGTLLSPVLGGRAEPFLGICLGDGGVDGAQVPSHLAPIGLRREPKRVTDQMRNNHNGSDAAKLQLIPWNLGGIQGGSLRHAYGFLRRFMFVFPHPQRSASSLPSCFVT